MTDATTRPARTTTSGSDTRPPRAIDRAMGIVDLDVEAASLLGEPEWTDGGRNTRTLLATDRLRIALVALRGGASIGDEATDDTLALEVIRGRVQLAGEIAPRDLRPREVLVLDRPHSWRLRALEESLVLLTTALDGVRS
jgi:hypothetical protein